MIKKKLFVLLMSLFSFGGIALADVVVPAGLHVYRCFGVSNMEGRADNRSEELAVGKGVGG